jgi:hypothetical protein
VILEAFIPWTRIDWLLQLELLIWLGTILLSFVLCYVRLRRIAGSEQDNQKQVD